MNDIIIYDTDSSEISIEHLYTIGGYATYHISVRSGDFSGKSNFCCSIETINSYMKQIDEMYTKLSGGIFIADCESDAYIEFNFKGGRSIWVSGQIGGSHEAHIMRFEFMADQIILPGLKRTLSYK